VIAGVLGAQTKFALLSESITIGESIFDTGIDYTSKCSSNGRVQYYKVHAVRAGTIPY
jgi:hypothetical protein